MEKLSFIAPISGKAERRAHGYNIELQNRPCRKFKTQHSKFKIGIADNSKLNIQNSKFKIGIADNSKLKTQNSKLKIGIADNSKLKTQNSKFNFSPLNSLYQHSVCLVDP